MPERGRPSDAERFGFTEQERLYDRVSDQRFRAILEDEGTTIHTVHPDENTFGDFLFVTISRVEGDQQLAVTAWGLGFHQHRERWLVDEWRWYTHSTHSRGLEQTLSKEEAFRKIDKRREQIAPYVTDGERSSRARLFELIADLTDEDGALAELEDLGDFPDFWEGDAD